MSEWYYRSDERLKTIGDVAEMISTKITDVKERLKDRDEGSRYMSHLTGEFDGYMEVLKSLAPIESIENVLHPPECPTHQEWRNAILKGHPCPDCGGSLKGAGE